ENRSARNQSLRPKSNRKTGGQPGHEGSTLKMSSTPNQIKEMIPGYCNACGNDLREKEAIQLSKRQVIDIPPVQPIVTEYRQYSRQCTCGHLQKAQYPAHITNHMQYGASVEAIAGYYSVYQYLPFKRLSDMFAHVFNLPISQGTIANILDRLATKAQPVYDEIHMKISQGAVVGGDETGAKVNGEKYWAWTWQNACLTFITVSASRGKQAVQQLFPDGFVNAILCSDRWAAHTGTHAKGHQLCLAHLLRDLNYLIELEQTTWAKQMKVLFQEAIRLKKESSSYNPKDPNTLAIERKLDQLLAQQLDKDSPPDTTKKTIVFQKAMKKHRNYLFTFLYYQDVPPDNNGSERAIRNFKVKMKVSGQFKTGHHIFAKLRSVADTCVKKSVPVFKAMTIIAHDNVAAE
ncbi:MAG: IS66 family transposase, partial [Marinoscillum sp.]